IPKSRSIWLMLFCPLLASSSACNLKLRLYVRLFAIVPCPRGVYSTFSWCPLQRCKITCGVFSCVAGTYLSYQIDASTGGTIVVFQVLIFVLAMIFAPRRGLLAVRRLRRMSGEPPSETIAEPVFVSDE
ncbi:MAG TPA: metal ABC transporter permease, partial [Aggregatilineaceae bacterium]|nr:metal ABC transporter permease [Aggregatilineaceae bacterium]